MEEILKGGDTQFGYSVGGLQPHEVEALEDLIRAHLEKRGFAFGLNYVASESASALERELGKIDLAEQFARGWSMLKTVRAARAAPPGETVVLSLGEHHIGLKASPTLKLTIGGVPAPDLTLSLSLTAQFDHATLSVRDRELVGADPGDCEIFATLSSGKTVIGRPWRLNDVRIPRPMRFAPCPIA